ncbi:unnamed protein product [Bursaphelenchus xylophilus]|uniref:(pine wood nematode) hypothetical protein n=1 Tax=Bursaphelenchus xylophilus TaxID=6326 RepID=A0A1I7RK90_BURXY|nr:unnamed protein product [Bursaphelenchus xylophilus]CAG9131416.1 unnamed protein product [Bursaphelenchus xylophilus]
MFTVTAFRTMFLVVFVVFVCISFSSALPAPAGYGYDLAPSAFEFPQLNMAKKWSRLEPSIRFFKRSQFDSDFDN